MSKEEKRWPQRLITSERWTLYDREAVPCSGRGNARHYFHPDVSVACGDQAGKMLTDPVVVIEVLSPATEKRDRDAKLATYKMLPSLMEYMLVGSTVKEIIVYRRENNWFPYHYQSGDQVELKSIGVSFPFDAVYRRITLG